MHYASSLPASLFVSVSPWVFTIVMIIVITCLLFASPPLHFILAAREDESPVWVYVLTKLNSGHTCDQHAFMY